MTVPGSGGGAAPEPKGDVLAGINYRRHNGQRQRSNDKDGHSHVVSVKTMVADARLLPATPTVATMGFALRKQPTGMKKADFYDDAQASLPPLPACLFFTIMRGGR